jgi:hypothetical protein
LKSEHISKSEQNLKSKQISKSKQNFKSKEKKKSKKQNTFALNSEYRPGP